MAAADYYNMPAQMQPHLSPNQQPQFQHSPHPQTPELQGSTLNSSPGPQHTPPQPPSYQPFRPQEHKPAVHFAPSPAPSQQHRPSFSSQPPPPPPQAQNLQPPPYHSSNLQHSMHNAAPSMAVAAQAPHMRPYMNENPSQYSLNGGYSSDPEHRRRRRHKSRDEEGSSRSRNERPRKSRSRSTNTDGLLGAAGGGLIGDLIFPGLGTVGGALAGWIGGKDYGKHRRYREDKLDREQKEWEQKFGRSRSNSDDRSQHHSDNHHYGGHRRHHSDH